MSVYETVIGLETHVQIKTESKLFCSCSTVFGLPPNTQICPICCGYPGVLPVLNKKAVERLIKTALALGCTVKEQSIFARKQYFYPDLPKNYQISQYEKPLSVNGTLEISYFPNPQAPPAEKKIGITRIHLEEDAGKLIHAIGAMTLNYSLVDLNRTGIPLMEIVSEPDLRSSQEAVVYLSSLKRALQYLDVSDCDMEKGSMRCDANISLRPQGSPALGTKVELKNMNTFRGVEEALEYEIERQTSLLERDEKIVHETRLWDAEKNETRPMRSKEEAHDYRYFPEPDLLPLHLMPDWIEAIRLNMPELPPARRTRFIRQLKLSEYDAEVLTSYKRLADYYEKSLQLILEQTPAGAEAGSSSRALPAPKLLCNWVNTELLGRLNTEGKTIEESPVSPAGMAELILLLLEETISGKMAKMVFDEMWKSGKAPRELVQEKGLSQVSDSVQIEEWAEQALVHNPKAAEEFKKGKKRALGAMVGTVMKLSKGQANPELVNQILKKKLTMKD